jgi:hypothetical protein
MTPPKLKPKYSSREHFSHLIDEAIAALLHADKMASEGRISFSASSRSVYKQTIDAAVVMAAHVDSDTWSEFDFRDRAPVSRRDLHQITKWLRVHTTTIEQYFEDRGFDVYSLDHHKFHLY